MIWLFKKKRSEVQSQTMGLEQSKPMKGSEKHQD